MGVTFPVSHRGTARILTGLRTAQISSDLPAGEQFPKYHNKRESLGYYLLSFSWKVLGVFAKVEQVYESMLTMTPCPGFGTGMRLPSNLNVGCSLAPPQSHGG